MPVAVNGSLFSACLLHFPGRPRQVPAPSLSSLSLSLINVVNDVCAACRIPRHVVEAQAPAACATKRNRSAGKPKKKPRSNRPSGRAPLLLRRQAFSALGGEWGVVGFESRPPPPNYSAVGGRFAWLPHPPEAMDAPGEKRVLDMGRQGLGCMGFAGAPASPRGCPRPAGTTGYHSVMLPLCVEACIEQRCSPPGATPTTSTFGHAWLSQQSGY